MIGREGMPTHLNTGDKYTMADTWRQVHNGRYVETSTQWQIRGDKYTIADTWRQVHNGRYVETSTQWQIRGDKYTIADTWRQVHNSRNTMYVTSI